MLLYFAYGSNLDQIAMKQRCPDSKPLQPACLKNFRLDFTFDSEGWEGGVADIVDEPGQEVWGLVYQISARDLENLDGYEGYPTAYTRFTTSVHTGTNILSGVWVYSVVAKRGFVPPPSDYLMIIKKAAWDLGFPEIYRIKLENIQTR